MQLEKGKDCLIRLPEWVKPITDAPKGLFTEEEKSIMLGKASAKVFDVSWYLCSFCSLT